MSLNTNENTAESDIIKGVPLAELNEGLMRLTSQLGFLRIKLSTIEARMRRKERQNLNSFEFYVK